MGCGGGGGRASSWVAQLQISECPLITATYVWLLVVNLQLFLSGWFHITKEAVSAVAVTAAVICQDTSWQTEALALALL